MKNNISGADILEKGAATFRERDAKYGSNYKKVGAIMMILFPDGLQLKTEYDHALYHLFSWLVGKLTRFASPDKPLTDLDSIHDLIVYAAMVQMMIQNFGEGNDNKE